MAHLSPQTLTRDEQRALLSITAPELRDHLIFAMALETEVMHRKHAPTLAQTKTPARSSPGLRELVRLVQSSGELNWLDGEDLNLQPTD